MITDCDCRAKGFRLTRRLFAGNTDSTAQRIKMTVENTTIKSRIKNLLRSPSIKLRRSKAGNNKENLSNKVTLEKVLGITSAGSRALACDPHSGLIAYPAGWVTQLQSFLAFFYEAQALNNLQDPANEIMPFEAESDLTSQTRIL